MKILPEGKPSLDGLPFLKTNNNIIAKNLGPWGATAVYYKIPVLLSKTEPNISDHAVLDF
jgi:hypothetical protein